MHETVEYPVLDDALRRCGATWNAAQAHGLLCSRLAVRGSQGVGEWLQLVLEGSDPQSTSRAECAEHLERVSDATRQQLAERLSQFVPLLPDDATPATLRAEALAHWCEGYLHGLVATQHAEPVRARLAEEPIADIIRDMLEITRATVDEDSQAETDEVAYTEVVEYVRVAAQLAYEELAEFRPAAGGQANDGRSGLH